jgi:2,3-bisphosphoglycerate-dependent phosphoglycerate mutase
MELIFVRHALPQRIENAEGAADPLLDPVGHGQADLMAAYLASEQIDAIWVSPMRRAQQTAAPLAAAFGIQVQTDDRLAEYDRHDSTYIPVEELKATNDPRWQAMVKGEWQRESDPVAFQATIVRCVDDIVSSNTGRRVAVVCHGGVINAYVAHVLGIGSPVGFFYPEYTSIHRVMAASTGERSVKSLNETSHLRGSDLRRALV